MLRYKDHGKKEQDHHKRVSHCFKSIEHSSHAACVR
jgi:hypothetical protein